VKNILANTVKSAARMHNLVQRNPAKVEPDIDRLVQFYQEIRHQYTLMTTALSGIDDEDLTTAEKQIKRILES
jgi:hypothetical protein